MKSGKSRLDFSRSPEPVFASITEDEIAFGCENYGVPYEELDGRVSNAIKRINGDMLRGKEIYPMSSGENRK